MAYATSKSGGSVSGRMTAGRTTSPPCRMKFLKGGWVGGGFSRTGTPCNVRGHLLLQENDGSLYAREIEGSSMCMTELYLGREKLLIETGQMEEPTEWYKFVSVHGRHQVRNKSVATGSSQIDVPIVAKLSYHRRFISTLAYTPTLYLASACSD